MRDYIATIIFAGFLLFGGVTLILLASGAYFQSIRFLFLGEPATINITRCEVCYTISPSQKGPDYLVYTLTSPDLNHKLTESSDIKILGKKEDQVIRYCNNGGTRLYTPVVDWCEKYGTKADIFYYEKSQFAVIANGGKLKSLFSSRSLTETLIVIVAFVSMTILVFALFVIGNVLFLKTIRTEYKVPSKIGDDKNQLFETINNYVIPTTTLLIALALIVVLSGMVFRSLILFDTPNVFISGVVGIIFLLLACLGSQTITWIVFWIRRENKIFDLIKNLSALIVTTRLLHNSLEFIGSDPEYSNRGEYFRELILAMLS